MGEFWGFVDWGAGCLALIVAVVFSFLLGVRTGRIPVSYTHLRAHET